MPGSPIRILGLSELIAALNAVDRDLSKALRTLLKEAAAAISDDASQRLAGLNPSPSRSAGSIRPKVRSAGLLTVEQTLGRTTGKRPDWGATQMRLAFLPAADAGMELAATSVEQAIDAVASGHGF